MPDGLNTGASEARNGQGAGPAGDAVWADWPQQASQRAARAFERACRLDVAVRKPGNVSLASPGHGMQAEQFVASALAASPGLCTAGASVGQRIEAAVRASWAAAGCNTNLGIVLLCAPLAAALERCGRPPADAADLHAALHQVLQGLSVDDAAAAFRAIALAQPGGLGRAEAHDVHDQPTVTLRAAMAAAADRDSIARQYRDGFDDLWQSGLPAAAQATGEDLAVVVQRIYLVYLAGWPDSHIVRKHGESLAHSVIGAAQPWLALARRRQLRPDDPALADWDASLKRQQINPGTSADLTVATLMLAALLPPAALAHGTDRDSDGGSDLPPAGAVHI